MTDKKIENRKVVGGDYFHLQKRKSSDKNLQYYLDQFNTDDYWIYKYTNNFREVSYQEFLEFKNAGYIFFRKDLYDKEYINWCIIQILKISRGCFTYLVRPFPPKEIMDRINIIL